MLRTCVIDTSTLINLTNLSHLGIFNAMTNVVSRIHVPSEILKEYQRGLHNHPERQRFVSRIQAGNGIFKYCTSYDSISLAIYKSTQGIDPGEAEAAAQQKKIKAQLILSDDSGFQTAIRRLDPNTRIWGTLEIVALLDLNKLLPSRDSFMTELYKRRPFESWDLRNAYQTISRYLGIELSKEDLSRKTSLKQLGLG